MKPAKGKLVTKVYWELKRSIATSELLPGTSLHEMEICDRLGVSRTPVREALKMLAAEGLVEPRRGAGYSVAQISRQDVIEAYQVRIWLEPHLAAGAARMADEKVTSELHALVDRMLVHPPPNASVTAAGADDLDDQYHLLYTSEARQSWTDLDAEFHNVISRVCGNSLATSFVQQARLVTQRASYLVPPGRLQLSYYEHRRIFDAIAQHDEKGAEHAMREHLNTTFRRLYSAGWLGMETESPRTTREEVAGVQHTVILQPE